MKRTKLRSCASLPDEPIPFTVTRPSLFGETPAAPTPPPKVIVGGVTWYVVPSGKALWCLCPHCRKQVFVPAVAHRPSATQCHTCKGWIAAP